MGNIIFDKMSSSTLVPHPKKETESPETFVFHESWSEDTNNGLFLNGVYMPEEIISHILSYVPPHELLRVGEVCKKWCNIVKSEIFWSELYLRKYHKKPKKLPWYLFYALFATPYFNNNLIKNGNGEKRFKHWKIVLNYGDQFRVEDPPCGARPLPEDVPEFNGKTSCFATSYYECNKLQEISFENCKLMQLIMNKHRPHIYLSEWMTGRFDCGCIYNLWCRLYGERSGPHNANSTFDCDEEEHFSSDEDLEDHLFEKGESRRVEQWENPEWSKVELLVRDYPNGVHRVVFQHEGRDTQFWKGHYGSKMAGAVLKILFEFSEA